MSHFITEQNILLMLVILIRVLYSLIKMGSLLKRVALAFNEAGFILKKIVLFIRTLLSRRDRASFDHCDNSFGKHLPSDPLLNMFSLSALRTLLIDWDSQVHTRVLVLLIPNEIDLIMTTDFLSLHSFKIKSVSLLYDQLASSQLTMVVTYYGKKLYSTSTNFIIYNN